MSRCAFNGCQAGGDILPAGPRVKRVVNRAFSQFHALELVEHEYHPGCWAAEQRSERAKP